MSYWAEMNVGQNMGMPRGWEVYSKNATDSQARYLLARLTRDNAILATGKNQPRPDDCSHSAMMYYRDETGRTRCGIEFTEHLRDAQTKQLATREGGMPCYGRYFVTDDQIDDFVQEFPDKIDKLQAALDTYSEPKGSYYRYGRTPQSASYVQLNRGGGRASDIDIKLNLAGGRSVREELRSKAALLYDAEGSTKSQFETTHPLHRVKFTAVRVPEAFEDAPIRPKYEVDSAGVEELLGDKMENGAYKDGYRIVCEFALDAPVGGDKRELYRKVPLFCGIDEYRKSGAPEGRIPELPPGMPNGAYLASYHVGKEIRHDQLITPDLMAEYLAASQFEIKPDGSYVGVTEAPVYATEQKGAIGSAKDPKPLMDFDYPESRAQIQNRQPLGSGLIHDKPPRGCVWAVDMMSGAAKVPDLALNDAEHRKQAAVQVKFAERFRAAKADMNVYAKLQAKQSGPEDERENRNRVLYQNNGMDAIAEAFNRADAVRRDDDFEQEPDDDLPF